MLRYCKCGHDDVRALMSLLYASSFSGNVESQESRRGVLAEVRNCLVSKLGSEQYYICKVGLGILILIILLEDNVLD